jgi:translation initiation factor 2 beta subunit (eIF-2beta)/eIF-5
VLTVRTSCFISALLIISTSSYQLIVGTKKTLWVNFQEICNTMKRNPEHLFQFMMAELGTEGSIDGNKRLVIRGKFVPKVRKNTAELHQY